MKVLRLNKVDVFRDIYILNLSGEDRKDALKILTRRRSMSPDMKKSPNCKRIANAIRKSGSELICAYLSIRYGVFCGSLVFRKNGSHKDVVITSSEAIGVAHEMDKPILSHNTRMSVLFEDYIGIPLESIISTFFD